MTDAAAASVSKKRKREKTPKKGGGGQDDAESKRQKKPPIYRDQQTHPDGLSKIAWPQLESPELQSVTIYIDEAGMGSFAGPLQIGGTYLLPGFDVDGLHDSKLLKPHERKRAYERILSSEFVIHHVESVSNQELDSVGGLGVAWRIGIQRVITAISKKLRNRFPDLKISRCVLDGNKSLTLEEDIVVVPVTKADQKFTGVSAASNCAKHTRDEFMSGVANNYPGFEEIFEKGKGYWFSKKHTEMIEAGNFTDLHRRTYNPLKSFLARQTRVVTPRILEKK